MREILFRGKRIDNGEWVEGNLALPNCKLRDNFGYFLEEKAYICPCLHSIRVDEFKKGTVELFGYNEVDPETIGQYTGLTDKNGKKVFEGDICRFREWSKGEMCWVGKVYWEHQQFMITGGPNKECETMFELRMSRFIPEDIEVIGNIHDNPELLEVDNG